MTAWFIYIMVLSQNAIVWHQFSAARFETEQECKVWVGQLNQAAPINERYFCLEK